MTSAVSPRSSPLSLGIEEPLDLVKLSLDEIVLVKMKGERELVGRLHAFDQHMNLVLEDVEETRRIVETKEENPATEKGHDQILWKTEVKKRGMLFIRGDSIILLSPVLKTNS